MICDIEGEERSSLGRPPFWVTENQEPGGSWHGPGHYVDLAACDVRFGM